VVGAREQRGGGACGCRLTLARTLPQLGDRAREPCVCARCRIGQQGLLDRGLYLPQAVDRLVERTELEPGKLACERLGRGRRQQVAPGEADGRALESLRAQRRRQALPDVGGAPDVVARDELLVRAGRIAHEDRRAGDREHERGVTGTPQARLRGSREEGGMVPGQPGARTGAIVERAP
jgi:hypothetical protein